MDKTEIYVKTEAHRAKLSLAMMGNTNVLKRWGNYEKMKATCLVCGKKFTRPPSVFKKGKGKYCSQICANRAKGKAISKRRHIKMNGYAYIKDWKHPYRSKQNLIAEHRLIIEKQIGRYLKPKETTHHIDGNKLNNEISNLLLCRTDSEHKRIERLDYVFLQMFNTARYEHWDEFKKFDLTKNRQDQIQEMFYKDFEEQGLSLVDKLCLFCFSFIKNDALDFPKWLSDEHGEYKCSSFEQLWLAFYFYEKHSKVWSSKEEKWVKK